MKPDPLDDVVTETRTLSDALYRSISRWWYHRCMKRRHRIQALRMKRRWR